MSKAETIKTIFRPFLTLILILTWIVFIAKEVIYPPALQWLVIVFAGEWLTERGLKRFKELAK